MSPVARRQVGVRQGLPHLLRTGAYVGDVDVVRHRCGCVGHGVLLCLVLDGTDRLEAGLVEAGDPALLDLVDRGRVEVVQPLPAASYDGDEVGPHEDVQVLRRGLACHVKALAQFAQRLSVVLA